MKTHARFGPSTLDSLSKCLRFKYLDSPEAANEGTELHKAFETENLNGLTEEQRTVVQQTLDYVESLKATEGGPENWNDNREMRLELRDLTYGTADRVLVHKQKMIAHVIDAKFGRLQGEHDFQVQTYAAALTERYFDAGVPLETVTTHVLSPRISDIQVKVYNAEELLQEIRNRIIALYEKIDDPFNPPTPNEDLCAKCARAAKCPALNQVAVAVAPRLGLPLPSAFAPDSLASDKDRAIAQVLAGALINWGEQVKKNNAAYVQNGGTILGNKLVTRSTGLRVPVEHTGLAWQVLRQHLDEDLLLSGSTLVLGRLASNIAEAHGIPEADAKEQLRTWLRDIAEEGSTSFLQKTKRLSDTEQLKMITENA